jgi:MFS transporter, SET family, sugar efflux transporter
MLSKQTNLNPKMYVLMFLVGTNSALLEPLMGVYLYKHVGLSPKAISSFYFFLYAGAILFSMLLPLLGDLKIKRKFLLLSTSLLGLFGYSSLYFFQDQKILILTSALLLAPAASNSSQIFSYVKQLSGSAQDVIFFRGIFSAAWVAGPAFGAIVAASFGFQALFLTLMISGALAVAFISVVPNVEVPPKRSNPGSRVEVSYSRFALIFVTFAVLQGTNSISLIYTSVIIEDRLGLSLDYSGYVFAFCAALEVGYFILISKLSPRLSSATLVMIAAVLAVIYYIVLTHAQNYETVFISQFVNAAFIAIINGVGMTWFQALMPSLPGLATGLFLNSFRIGTLVLLPFATYLSSMANGAFQDGILVAIGGAAFSLVLLLFICATERKATVVAEKPSKT